MRHDPCCRGGGGGWFPVQPLIRQLRKRVSKRVVGLLELLPHRLQLGRHDSPPGIRLFPFPFVPPNGDSCPPASDFSPPAHVPHPRFFKKPLPVWFPACAKFSA